MSQQEVKTFKLYDKAVVIPIDEYVGINDYKFKVISGSRLLITMYVKSLDLGATASIKILNAFSDDNNVNQWDDILNFSSSDIGYKKQVLTDFNQFFNLRLEVTGGQVELAVAVSIFDNAMTTRIENAEIDINLSDKASGTRPYDITRIGDGARELSINNASEVKVHDQNVLDKLQEVVDSIADDNDNLPTGASTEAKQDIQIGQLQELIDGQVDLLDGQTGMNLLLGDINTELDAQTSALSLLNAKDYSTSAKQDVSNTLLSNILTEEQGNLRQKILKAFDRDSLETTLDFGTKNERVVQIDYTAPSVGVGAGFTARKVISYVLESNKYKRTTTTWSIV